MLYWLIVPCLPAQSPNLVPNPDFEEYEDLPKNVSEFYKLKDWFNPVGKYATSPNATPDFFHTKAEPDAQLPTLKWASGLLIAPKSGKGIAGLIGANKLQVREYLCVQLLKPLEKGRQYAIQFYYSNGKGKPLGALASKLGIGFSQEKPIQSKTDIMEIDDKVETSSVINSKDWSLFKETYTAKNNYDFLAIGNFSPDNADVKMVYDKSIFASWAYYFIDSVSVVDITPPPPPEKEKITITQEEEKILERASYVQFKTGEALILPESYHILDDVVDLLNRYLAGKLSLEGHTDNVGTAERNLMLSKARAEAIKVYFVAKGIQESRISTEGFGLTRPKDTNETIEGRAKNRRVEMKFKSVY